MHLLDIPETVWGTWKRRAAVGGDPNEMFARDIGLAKNVGAEKGEAAMGFVWDLCREMADMLPGPRAGSGGGASAQGPAPRDFFRLPYKTYKAVWVAYCEHVFMRDTGRVPVGGEELVRPPISLQHFRRCWSDNEEIESTVKLQPDKGEWERRGWALGVGVGMGDGGWGGVGGATVSGRWGAATLTHPLACACVPRNTRQGPMSPASTASSTG